MSNEEALAWSKSFAITIPEQDWPKRWIEARQKLENRIRASGYKIWGPISWEGPRAHDLTRVWVGYSRAYKLNATGSQVVHDLNVDAISIDGDTND